MNDLLGSLARKFDSRAADRLALTASVILVILLAQALASLTWALVPQPQQSPPPPPQVAVSTAARPDYHRIAALHLFGQPKLDTAKAGAPVDAPETRLDLSLRGILYNSDPRFARAIIAAPGKEDAHYSVGDQVGGGATISQIHPDRVMLLRNGQYETLRLPDDRLDLSGGAPAASASPPVENNNLPSAGAGVLSEYRRQIIESPETAGQFLQAEPVNRAGGGIVGFRVSPGADAGMFQIAGLQAGDIVTDVNGVRLDTQDKGFEAIEQLAASDQVTLKVLRNGQEVTLNLQLRNN